MRVKLVAFTPDPLTQIYAQARMTTTKGDFEEIYNNASTDRKIQLVADTLDSGHWSVSRWDFHDWNWCGRISDHARQVRFMVKTGFKRLGIQCADERQRQVGIRVDLGIIQAWSG